MRKEGIVLSIAGEGSLFTPKAVPLSELLSDIHTHKIALPNFQRPWSWEPERVFGLIISVAYRYPAGSLLTMPVLSTNFALRPFDGSGHELVDKPNLMVLDGQQRLTSLYQALYKCDGVRYKGRNFHFYLDIPHLMSDPDGSIDIGDSYFETAIFYVLQEKNGSRNRYDGLIPRYSLTSSEDEMAAGALPLGLLFDANGKLAEWKKNYLVKRSGRDMDRYLELDKTWNNLVQPWLDRIRNYPFPVIELRADMPLSAICHIFEKVNSTGLPLDVFDLCTAILWAQGFYLNEMWDKTKKEFGSKKILSMQPLSGTAFLQSLALLDSIEKKRKNPGSRLAVACRKQDLMELSRTTVERWWDVLVEGYKEASKFMADQGILSERILPYSTMIIPLTAIFADIRHRKGEVSVGAAWPKIRQWYWCSVFSQRYSGPVESNSAVDFEQVVDWAEGGPQSEAVRTFTFRSDALQEIASIRNAIYKGVLCLLANNGATDFSGGGSLNTALFYETRQDHHHIFPTEALKQLEIEDPRSNTIVNKTLISASVNRSISGRLPSEYVEKWSDRLESHTFEDILITHAINPDILSSNDWNAFVHDRREKLRKMIENVCGGVFQPFTDLVEMNISPEEDE